jgi:mannose-6-phosphate isomerase-like protein (cupin superfamily)
LETYDINAILSNVPPLVITDETTGEEADAAVGVLSNLNGSLLGVMRFSGQTPWERHSKADELLHVLEGAVKITILTNTEPVQLTLKAGQVFIVPQGLWHRQYAHSLVTLLFATPTPSDISFAEDPRQTE